MNRLPPWIPGAIFAATLLTSGCSLIAHVPDPPRLSKGYKPSISREDAIADVDSLMRTMENVHPNLYALHSRDEMMAERQRIVAELPDSMSRAEWYTRLSPLVAGIGDGHTTMESPVPTAVVELLHGANTDEQVQERSLVLPASVGVDDKQQLIVTAVYGENVGIERGDRILSVNGHNADGLIAEWMRETSGDSDANRAAYVTSQFWILLPLHSILAPFAVRVVSADGGERNVTIQGITITKRGELLRQGQPASHLPNFRYQTLEPGIGYMAFYSMDDGVGRFKKDVRAMFRKVAADSVRTLIVDIRQNGGGDVELGEALLRYITDKPYRTWSSRQWKRSAEVRDYGKHFLRPPLRWLPFQYLFADGRRVSSGAVGSLAPAEENPIKAHARAEPFFSGRVCVLTGPTTFSAAAIFADAVKTYHLATIVGDETGGHPNLYSFPYEFRLPRSGFLISVSAMHWVRANGDPADLHGVIPDIVVKPTAADIRDGRDVVLERARNCPKVE